MQREGGVVEAVRPWARPLELQLVEGLDGGPRALAGAERAVHEEAEPAQAVPVPGEEVPLRTVVAALQDAAAYPARDVGLQRGQAHLVIAQQQVEPAQRRRQP